MNHLFYCTCFIIPACFALQPKVRYGMCERFNAGNYEVLPRNYVFQVPLGGMASRNTQGDFQSVHATCGHRNHANQRATWMYRSHIHFRHLNLNSLSVDLKRQFVQPPPSPPPPTHIVRWRRGRLLRFIMVLNHGVESFMRADLSSMRVGRLSMRAANWVGDMLMLGTCCHMVAS